MKMTPMLRQYFELKEQAGTALLLYRMGDFYELFFEDAQTAAPVLGITLTRRRQNDSVDAPMCGVPHHAFDGYLGKLLDAGFRVAVAEQVEDPATAKGLVRREIIRTHTPGTISDTDLLDGSEHCYLAAFGGDDEAAALAWIETQHRNLRRRPSQRSAGSHRAPREASAARDSHHRRLGWVARGVARRSPAADGDADPPRHLLTDRRRAAAAEGPRVSDRCAASALIRASPWSAWPAPSSAMSNTPRRAR